MARPCKASHCGLFGPEAHFLNALPAAMARGFSGRSVWSVTKSGLTRHRLSNGAKFVELGSRSDLPTTPSTLRAHSGGLLARSGSNLLLVPKDFRSAIQTASIPGWGWWWNSDLSDTLFLESGAVAAPAGEYGIEILW